MTLLPGLGWLVFAWECSLQDDDTLSPTKLLIYLGSEREKKTKLGARYVDSDGGIWRILLLYMRLKRNIGF